MSNLPQDPVAQAKCDYPRSGSLDILARSVLLALVVCALYFGREIFVPIAYRMEWKAWAINVEQMARVGEPAPRAIIRRLNRTGTDHPSRVRVRARFLNRTKLLGRSTRKPIHPKAMPARVHRRPGLLGR
jgi:hypothetical protein